MIIVEGEALHREHASLRHLRRTNLVLDSPSFIVIFNVLILQNCLYQVLLLQLLKHLLVFFDRVAVCEREKVKALKFLELFLVISLLIAMLNQFAVCGRVRLLLIETIAVHVLLFFVKFLTPPVRFLHVLLELTDSLLLFQRGFLVDLGLQRCLHVLETGVVENCAFCRSRGIVNETLQVRVGDRLLFTVARETRWLFAHVLRHSIQTLIFRLNQFVLCLASAVQAPRN